MQRSETIGNLAKALAAFNSKVSKIAKDAENPFFKNNYATLDNIIDEVRPILTENGLTLMQFPSGDGNNVSVTTYIMHESGEYIESDPLIMKPVKNDPQAVGSCISYARRYSLQAFLSLNTGSDDDGNNATHTQPPNKGKQQNQQQPSGTPGQSTNLISEPQKKALNTLIGKVAESRNITRDDVLATLMKKPGIGQFESTTKLTKSQASKAIATLQEALGEAQ